MEDQVRLVVYAQEEYLLVETASKNLRLPSSTLFKNEDFSDAALRLLDKELHLSGDIKGIVKIQHQFDDGGPGNGKSKLTVIFLVELNTGQSERKGVSSIQHWLKEENVLQQPKFIIEKATVGLLKEVSERLRRGEAVYPCEVLECMKTQSGKKVEKRRETDTIGERPQLVRAKSLEDQMLQQSDYGIKELKQIEDEFVAICGSSSLMNLKQFSALMIKLGFIPDLCRQCFEALKTDPEMEGLTLRELQIGLCCLDPSTVHGGLGAQFRCQFIFYFYNSGKEYLHFEEFKQMVKDICTFKKISLEEKDLEKSAMDNWRIFCADQKQGISLDLFLSVVGQLKFRGTSVLFRLPRPPVSRLNIESTMTQLPNSPMVTRDKHKNGEEAMDTSSGISSIPDSSNLPDPPALSRSSGYETSKLSVKESGCEAVHSQEYTIATHFVKVKRSGTLTEVTTLWDLVGTEAVSGSLDSVLDSRPGFDRLPSINAFDKQSKSNEMLSGLRYFEHALKDNGRGQPKPAFSWGAVDMVSVARCFMQLCAKAIDVFTSEARLLDFSSPCYVLGDLHGNFHDLVCFEKVLWRMGPVLTPASFLFLGDYVDRGPHGFEVVAYLLAQKLLMPSKFLLIRGNHEIRAVQETFTFKHECLDKFGPELGLEVWDAVNSAFDAMPIAAVIDKKVFCVHGGIPMPNLMGTELISAINDIPAILSNPMEESPLAWDLLWNDPIRQDDIDLDIEVQLEANKGFIHNIPRGTAHMFSTAALEEFLSCNNLSHVIRAHECKSAGFQIQQHGHLLTVFSSSHYCGATNEAACVLVDSKKIRTIRLDTT